MYWELIVLRVVHVLGGIFWLGTSLFIGNFLMPVLASMGPGGGAVVAGLYKRKLFTVVPTVAIVTMLAGLRLMQIQSSGFSAAWYATRSARFYVFGGASAVMAFILFMAISHAALMKNLALGQQMATASDADKAALMKQMDAGRARAEAGGKASGIFLVAAAIAMAVGRYV